MDIKDLFLIFFPPKEPPAPQEGHMPLLDMGDEKTVTPQGTDSASQAPQTGPSAKPSQETSVQQEPQKQPPKKSFLQGKNLPWNKKKTPKKTEKKDSSSNESLDKPLLLVGGTVLFLLFITGLWVLWANHRSANLSHALDPQQVQGLRGDWEFNPHQTSTVLNIQEGQDRSVATSNLGSTLPIISRFNYKSFTDKMFEVAGSAPWALTENFTANISDPELIRYLLSRKELAVAFTGRPDVAPLLEDPQLLAAFAQDTVAMGDFFNDPTVQAVLANEQMVKEVSDSLFMSYLLVSPSLKYFRNNPREAEQIISGNPYLDDLRQNPAIRRAVTENRYLKPIAGVLLGNTSGNPKATSTASSAK